MCLSHSIRIDLSTASLQLVCVDEEGETQQEKEQRDGAPDSEWRNQPDEHEEETQGRAERKADGALRRRRRPVSERTRSRKNEKKQKESSGYVLQFIWSFIRGSQTERGRAAAEQKQSGHFSPRRDVWPKSISAPALPRSARHSAPSRLDSSARGGRDAHTHT